MWRFDCLLEPACRNDTAEKNILRRVVQLERKKKPERFAPAYKYREETN